MAPRSRVDAAVYGETVQYCCDIPYGSSVGDTRTGEQHVRDHINFLMKQANEVANEDRKPLFLAEANALIEKLRAHLASGAKSETPAAIPDVSRRYQLPGRNR